MIQRLKAWLAIPFLHWCERSTNEYLTSQLSEAQFTITLKDIEIAALKEELSHLAAIIARDRKRVQAETADFARRIPQEAKGA